MKRCMQYFCIGLMLSFQLTAQASIRDSGSIPVDFDGLEHFKYSNGIVYVTLGSDGLKFFELSKPNNIEECSNKVVHCQLLGNSVNQLDIVGDYVYLLTDYGLEIVDSSRTQRVGALAINDTRKIVLQNDLAYIISGDKQVHIVDVSNTKSPKKLSTFESDLYGFDKIAVSDSYIYLTGTGVRYFFIVDVSNPASPKETIRYVTKETVSNLAVIGDYLYVIGSSASIFDVKTDPSNPKEIKLANPLYFSPLLNIIIQGKYAYFIGSDSLTIVDITNPKNPISKESYSFPNNTVYKVSVSGDYIYLADKTGLKQLKFEPVAVVCSYTVNTTPITLEDFDANSADGSSTGNLEVKTNSPYCEWTAQSNSDWLTISPSEGLGNATIQYISQPNASLEIRAAKLTIAGKTIDVTQKRLGAWVLFDENFDSIYPTNTYTKTYKKGQTIDAVNLYVFHLYSALDMTDFWLAISLPPSLGSGWMYKKTPNATVDFVPFSLTQLETMKPLVTNITDADRLKDGFGEYTWSVIPLLQNGAGLPTGEYTFYAVATIKERDKTSPTVKWISYNPITYFGDLTKIFSNLAIFKLIITD